MSSKRHKEVAESFEEYLEAEISSSMDYLTIQTPKHLSAFRKIDLQENFPVLICHLSRRGGGEGWRKAQKLPEK
jgi:hypothetical protein